jgi:hypothetical protein
MDSGYRKTSGNTATKTDQGDLWHSEAAAESDELVSIDGRRNIPVQ